MKHRESWFLGAVIALLLFLIFFMPLIGMRLRWIVGPQSPPPAAAAQLMAENEALSAKLSTLTAIADELPNRTPDTVVAMVYSDYPFNFKNEMTVNAGSADSVAMGDAAIFDGNLVGFVSEVSAHRSVIQTIFDPDFKLQVRIGAKGNDALLVGGSYPMAKSIAKTATIVPGDVVYSAASNAPYAVPVGIVASAALAPDNLFEQASLSFPYSSGEIQAVEIVKQ